MDCPDIIGETLKNITICEYAAVCLVCTQWHRIAARIHQNGAALSRSYAILAACPELLGYVDDVRRIPRSVVANVQSEDIESILRQGGSPKGQQYRSDITIELIRKYTGQFDFLALSKNPNIPLRDILRYEEYPWCREIIRQRPDMTVEVALAAGITWGWHFILRRHSKKAAVTLQLVSSIPQGAISWYSLSYDKFVTEELVEAFIHSGWDFSVLTENKRISAAFMMKHYTKNWCWMGCVDELPLEWILAQHAEISGIASYHSDVTPDIIRAHPEICWDYCELSRNKNMTAEFIVKTINENWDFTLLVNADPK